MGLAEALLGKQNPFTQWVSENQGFLGAVGSGLGQGQNIQSGLSAGLSMMPQAKMMDLQAAEKRKAEQMAAQQANATKSWLQANHPDLAQMVDAGMPVSEAWQAAMQRMQPGEQKNPYMSAGDGTFFNWQTGDFLTNPNAQTKMPDAPKGFMWAPDGRSLQRIPGGPEDPSINAPAAAVNLQRLNSQTDNVIQAIDKATGQVAWDSTGVFGQVLGAVGGTKAMDLRETAKTIKANLGFAELQAMRDASPTGGALGQVAVQELEALQATLASLNPDQSEAQLRENLATVKTLLERQKMFREQANQAKFAAPAGGGQWTVLGVE